MVTTDCDAVADDAWKVWGDNLIRRLPDMQRKEFVEIAIDNPDRYRTLVTFTLTGSGRIRCTIEGAAIAWTGRDQWLQTQADLAALGWRRLERKHETICEAGRRKIGDLVAIVVRSLREVWGLHHPSILTVHDPFVGRHTPPPPAPIPAPIVVSSQTPAPAPTPALAPASSKKRARWLTVVPDLEEADDRGTDAVPRAR